MRRNNKSVNDLSQTELDALRVHYINGTYTSKTLGRLFGLGAANVRKICKDRGWRAGGCYVPSSEKEYIRHNAGKLTGKQMADGLGISHGALKKRAQNLGVSLRVSKVKYPHNRKFFETKGLNQAYVAGWMATDGTLYSANSTIALSLSIIDEDIVGHIRNLLDYKGPIITDTGGQLHKRKLAIYGAVELFNALVEKYNVTPLKTKSLQPPSDLTLDTPELFFAFLAGTIEGDGSISPNRTSLTVSLEMASPDFVYWVQRKVIELIPVMGSFEPRTHLSKRSVKLQSGEWSTYYKFQCSGPTARYLCQRMIDTGVTRMDRKWDRARTSINWHKARDRKLFLETK